MEKKIGLQYKALDLHIHTPGSGKDYQENEITPDDIVDQAIRQNLDGICITDHNSGDWIDKINKAAKGKDIVIFPGVEVSVAGGKNGAIHVVGIFEPGYTTERINDFLSSVGLFADQRGKTDELAEGSVIEVIQKIHDHGGLPILAHADSSHGVLHDLKGITRKNIIQDKYLAAVEITKDKTKEFLDGSDPTYQRYLPTYMSSDAHCLDDIGKKRTYFKMGNLKLDALRQCFYDGKVRILTKEQFDSRDEGKFPKINEIYITGGFFDETRIKLHSGQNTIIGGQGVGKSLVIEFIRFALKQISPIAQIREDNESKISSQLGIGNRVSLIIEVKNGVNYKVEREFDNKENPVVITNLETDQEYQGSIEALFPVMAYSQTEAVFISRDDQAQIALIDKLIDSFKVHKEIKNCHELISQNDHLFSDALKAADKLAELETYINTQQELLANIEKSLQNEKFTNKKQAQEKKNQLESELLLIQKIKLFFQETAENFKILCAWNDEEGEENQDNELRLATEASNLLINKIIKKMDDYQVQITETHEKIKSIIDAWLPEYEKVEDEYKELLTTLGDDLEALEKKRRELYEEIESLKTEKSELSSIVSKFDQIRDDRTNLLDELDRLHQDLYRLRSEKFDELTQLSNNKLNLHLEQGAKRTLFSSRLKEIATGTRIQKSLLDIVADKLSPREFVDLIIRKEFDLLESKTGLSVENVEKLVSHFNNIEAFEQVLELQYLYYPEDVPHILFRMDDGEYKEIREVSIGQRCTALLIIALISGDFPIIIDQPEESIDIASVFDDIVNKLRNGKDYRQFILTTHNPNIAVTADSDLIHILCGTSSSGEIRVQGAIEDEEVRNEVIQHLEGGEEPYLIRGKKYRILE